MQITRIAEHVLEVRFAEVPSLQTTRKIRLIRDLLEQQRPAGFQECVPAYLTLTVFFRGAFSDMEKAIATLIGQMEGEGPALPRVIEVPVCYHPDFALDHQEVCEHTGLSWKEVVELHSSRLYTVQMIGFMPGFPYLSGLDPRLRVPRKASPRLKVPAGSVGLAGQQTGIYPLDLPGGWQIIGRTGVQLFDLQRDPPVLLNPGDHLRFVPVEPDAMDG